MRTHVHFHPDHTPNRRLDINEDGRDVGDVDRGASLVEWAGVSRDGLSGDGRGGGRRHGDTWRSSCALGTVESFYSFRWDEGGPSRAGDNNFRC